MVRLLIPFAIWAFAVGGWANAVETEMQFRVPSGLVIEQVAGVPQTRFPMFAVFDDRGRLYVAESSGLDLYEELKAQTRRCRVRRLEDRDGDGRFESSIVFADKLVFPMGLCWRDGKLYVADPPDLVTYQDRDGDGHADQRTVILTGFGHRDNGSLHGLIFGPDGLLYMTMGKPDGYRLERKDGSILTGKSGALIRCRPDGSDPEVVCRGFDNLVEVVFTLRGEVIGTDNWFQKPTGGLRDALVDLAPGGLYPQTLEDRGTPQPVTGPELPAISLFPAVAPSGLLRYEGGALDEDFRGDLFSAQHNARCVQRHELSRVGSTFATRDFDFVTSNDPDFHPSDVLQSADGSLLVIDTGGWYVDHCPTGRIRNSMAPGGIYRVRPADANDGQAREGNPASDPWGLELVWDRSSAEQLCRWLSDPRPAVRDRASQRLVALGEDAVETLAAVLEHDQASEVKQRALWILARIDHPSSLVPMRQALEASQTSIVATAARALARRKDKQCAVHLCKLLSAQDPDLRRAAAEALACCGESPTLSAVLDALTNQPDRFLEHALIHAVYRIASKNDLLAGLEHPHPAVQRCALILLDQHPHRAATSEQVVPRLSSPQPALRETALRILGRHPEWAEEAHTLLHTWLSTPSLSAEAQAAAQSLLLAFQAQPTIQRLVGEALKAGQLPASRWLLLLRTVEQSSVAKLPQGWVDGLALGLRDSDARVQTAAVRAAATLQLPELDAVLFELADQQDAPAELRLQAIRATAARRQGVSSAAFQFLIEQLNEESSPLGRLTAAEVLGSSQLDDSQLLVLLERVPADPLIWPQLLAAFRKSNSEKVGIALVQQLEKFIATGGWRPTDIELTQVLEPFPSAVHEKAAGLLAQLRQKIADVRSRLARYASLTSGGNAQRGQKVFFGKQTACSACHRVGSEGGIVGPDLTRIGAVRSSRDLLESIVAPSSTFAQGYENYIVVTDDGRIVNGLIARQSPETLVLREAGGKEIRFHKDQIETMARHSVSVMPEGLDRKLTPQQLQDLIAFLQSLK